MATRSSDLVGRLALERARARDPGLALDSIEVVELARDCTFVLVWTAPAGVVVLDARGRLVRGRDRLIRIARHLRAVRMFEEAQRDAQLERRLERARQGIEFLERTERDDARRVIAELHQLELRLEALLVDRQRSVLTTERTLRTRIELHNDAARADRSVVLAARTLAGELARDEAGSSSRSGLDRWLLARLGSLDLPFFHPELDARESASFVADLVSAVRAS